MNVLNIAVAIAFCFSFIFLLWTIKGCLLKPVIGDKDACITITISAKGQAQALERTVSGLQWMKQNGSLDADILIVDEGLSPKAAKLARLLSTDDNSVQVCSPDQIEYFIRRSCEDGGEK